MKILRMLLGSSLVLPMILVACSGQNWCDGKNGQNGENGQNGQNGEDGGFFGGNGGNGGNGGSSSGNTMPVQIHELEY